jgi:deazaflavin-dependent oxidoreductase (nitroreductase family)
MAKLLFKIIMSIFVSLYRLTGGRVGGTVQRLRVLLLTTTGRKTGKRRTTPLGFFEHEGSYVIIASNAGFDTHPAWFHNLKSQPRAAVEIGRTRLEVNAEVAGPDARSRLWARLMELAPSYGAYAERTRREIPLVVLRPVEV